MTQDRKQATRLAWLEALARHRKGFEGPDSQAYWATEVDAASRDEIVAIQNDKLAALTPFLYENSDFYRRRFDRLGLAPTDIRTIDDLGKWPVVDKQEMVEDSLANPPYGTYQTIDDADWVAATKEPAPDFVLELFGSWGPWHHRQRRHLPRRRRAHWQPPTRWCREYENGWEPRLPA